LQWIYLICFILLSAGLLALFGVKPGDFIDALFRSQRKSATLSDELNVLLGTPAKGFFNQDYELKQILKGTGRADRYEAIKRLSLILFAVGAVLALLIGNVYMVPILGIGFSLIPIWYLRSTAASYKKHLNEELETAISIITTSYLRTEDLIRSVKENLPYVTKPFPMSVFQKKLSVVLGRLAKQSGGDCYEDGALSINFSEMTASLSGKALVFTPLEYRLLKILTKNPQNVLTRQVLLEKLWDADGNFVDEHALTAAISRVRNKIETEGRQYIKTVYGMGYMWIGGAPK